MKRMLAAGFITAIAVVGSAGAASAAPATPPAAACFGQTHKAVNDGFVAGISNVGELVKFAGGGQAKNDLAKTFC